MNIQKDLNPKLLESELTESELLTIRTSLFSSIEHVASVVELKIKESDNASVSIFKRELDSLCSADEKVAYMVYVLNDKERKSLQKCLSREEFYKSLKEDMRRKFLVI